MAPTAAATPTVIKKTPGVMGGEACVGNTRITVWILVGLKQLGASDADLLRSYPTLSQTDLDVAWDYYRLHSEEIDEVIRLQEADDEDE